MSLSQNLRVAVGAALLATMAMLALLPAGAAAQTTTEPPAAAAAEPPAAAEAQQPLPPPPIPTVGQEEVYNPFGLQGMWETSDNVKRGTLVILIIMSIASWYVIFVKYFETRAMIRSAREGSARFWKSADPKAGVAELKDGSVLRYIAEQGIRASDHHEGTMVESIDKHTWINMTMDRAVGSVVNRLSSGMSLLATVGSTAPFVGLFGTTWGIYNALVEIGLTGQASIDRVAGPVGAALILTAVGLAVAVPAVMGYNWLVRRNKLVIDETRAFAGDLQNVLLSGRR